MFLSCFSGERPFICELCGNSYTDIKNLKKHKAKVHSGECMCLKPALPCGGARAGQERHFSSVS